MRTTLELEDEAYHVAKAYASAHHLTLGRAVSRLLLTRSQSEVAPASPLGLPQFRMNRMYTAEEIKVILLDTED